MSPLIENTTDYDETSPPILGCKHVLRLDMELVEIRKKIKALEELYKETKLRLLEKELVE